MVNIQPTTFTSGKREPLSRFVWLTFALNFCLAFNALLLRFIHRLSVVSRGAQQEVAGGKTAP